MHFLWLLNCMRNDSKVLDIQYNVRVNFKNYRNLKISKNNEPLLCLKQWEYFFHFDDPVFEILQLHYTILSNASFYYLMLFQLLNKDSLVFVNVERTTDWRGNLNWVQLNKASSLWLSHTKFNFFFFQVWRKHISKKLLSFLDPKSPKTYLRLKSVASQMFAYLTHKTFL